MKKIVGFRTITYKPKWENGAYQIDWAEIPDIDNAIKEGFEPFQVLQVGSAFVILLNKYEKYK